MKTSLALILSGGVSLALASSDPFSSCNLNSEYPPNRNPQWYCDVCGEGFNRGSAPIGCSPNNATFDDIPLGSIGHYQRTNWTNFENIANILPFVKPASKPNFAKLCAGKTGVLNFDINLETPFRKKGGFLSSFRYACARPLTSLPVPCTVTVAETCLVNPSSGLITLRTDTTTFKYNGTSKSGLAQSNPRLPTILTCVNATISAKSAVGTPVDLYLDEVLHGIWLDRSDSDPI